MRPIIATELRRRRWPLFWWSLAIAALVVMTLAFYPTIKDQQAELNKSFGQLSPAVVDLFSDTGEFFSPIGYLSSQIFYLLFPLLLSMYAIGLGSSLLAKEERSGTLELLLARPVSRTGVLLAKAAAGTILVGVAGLTGLVATVVMSASTGIDVGLGGIAFTAFMAWLFSILLGAIAFALTAAGRAGRRMGIGIAALVGFGGYLATSFESKIDWIIWPARLFPFHYYRPAEMLGGTVTWGALLGFVAATSLLVLAAIVRFRRRDLS